MLSDGSPIAIQNLVHGNNLLSWDDHANWYSSNNLNADLRTAETKYLFDFHAYDHQVDRKLALLEFYEFSFESVFDAKTSGGLDSIVQDVSDEHFGTSHQKALRISKHHMMLHSPNCDRNIRFVAIAEDVKVGDCIFTMANANVLVPRRVYNKIVVLDHGFYAPLSFSGRLVVDGVAVSSYALGSDVQVGARSHPVVHGNLQMLEQKREKFSDGARCEKQIGTTTPPFLRTLEFYFSPKFCQMLHASLRLTKI